MPSAGFYHSALGPGRVGFRLLTCPAGHGKLEVKYFTWNTQAVEYCALVEVDVGPNFLTIGLEGIVAGFFNSDQSGEQVLALIVLANFDGHGFEDGGPWPVGRRCERYSHESKGVSHCR